MSKQDDLLDDVQEAYRLLYEAKIAFSEIEAKRLRLKVRGLLEGVVGRIGEEGELK